MSKENPLWGAPRIHGELLKLGFEIAESTRKRLWMFSPLLASMNTRYSVFLSKRINSFTSPRRACA